MNSLTPRKRKFGTPPTAELTGRLVDKAESAQSHSGAKRGTMQFAGSAGRRGEGGREWESRSSERDGGGSD